jgi:RNA polymerase subunit RPABC4/transcription elongation factor Spt4/flagellar biosynthesis protein FliQ
MLINPEILPDILLALTVLGAAFIIALWISLIVWTVRDIRSRTGDFLPVLLSVLVVFLFFIPGIVIYLLLRPARTIEESFQNALEEEALLHTIEETPLCPGCNRRVQPDWIICPTCQSRLKKTCDTCRQTLELDWEICPYCAQIAPQPNTGDTIPLQVATNEGRDLEGQESQQT